MKNQQWKIFLHGYAKKKSRYGDKLNYYFFYEFNVRMLEIKIFAFLLLKMKKKEEIST